MSTLTTQSDTIKDIYTVDDYVYVISANGLDVFNKSDFTSYSSFTLANVTCGFAGTGGVYLGTSSNGVYKATVPVTSSNANLTHLYNTVSTPAIGSNNVTGIYASGTSEVITTDGGIDFVANGTTTYTYTGTLTNGFKCPAIYGTNLFYGISTTDGGGCQVRTTLPTANWNDGNVTSYYDYPVMNYSFTTDEGTFSGTPNAYTSYSFSANGLQLIANANGAPSLQGITVNSVARIANDALFTMEYDWDDYSSVGSAGQAAYYRIGSSNDGTLLSVAHVTFANATRKYFWSYKAANGTTVNGNDNRGTDAGGGTIFFDRQFANGTFEVQIGITDSANANRTNLLGWANASAASNSSELYMSLYTYTQANIGPVSCYTTRAEITSLSSNSGGSPMVTLDPNAGFHLKTLTTTDVRVASDIFIGTTGGVTISNDLANNVDTLSTELTTNANVTGIDVTSNASNTTGTLAFITSTQTGVYDIANSTLTAAGGVTNGSAISYVNSNFVVHDG